MEIFLNTSNKGKLDEFKKLFSAYGISLKPSYTDLAEIDSDPISVIVHKVSSLNEHCLVDDTSLEVEGCKLGVNIRWFIEELDKHIGKQATWTVLLAYKQDGRVYLYEGKVIGKIVQPKGEGGFSFDRYFLPACQDLTLAQSKPDKVNARAIAVENFVNKNFIQIHKPITSWQGPWQSK